MSAITTTPEESQPVDKHTLLRRMSKSAGWLEAKAFSLSGVQTTEQQNCQFCAEQLRAAYDFITKDDQ
jgi:hypothetical protein